MTRIDKGACDKCLDLQAALGEVARLRVLCGQRATDTALAVAQEREACARLCDEADPSWLSPDPGKALARAIRARGQR